MIAALRQPFLFTTRIGQLILALLAGVVLGFTVIFLSGQNFPMKLVALCAGGLAGLVVLLLSKDIRRLLLIAIYIDTSTAFDFHLTCTDTYYVSSCGFNISVTALALGILIATWIIKLRRVPGSASKPFLNSVGISLLAFISTAALSLTQARLVTLGLYQIWIFIVIFLTFLYVSNHIRGEDDVRFYIYSMAVGLSIQVGIMEMQALGLVGNAQGDIVVGNRITGTLHSPNIAGGYLAQVIMLIFSALFLQLPRRHKIVLAVLFALSLHSLIGTESRGAWSGAALGAGVILVMGVWHRWIKLQALIPILLVGAVFGLLFSDTIINRFTQDDNGAAEARGPLAEIAYNMIRENPVTGVGINNFGVVLHNYIEPGQYGAWLSLVHNYWLLVWSETGTIGFAAYIIFWLSTIRHALRLIWSRHPVYGIVATGLLASLLAVGAHMLGEIYSGRNSIQLIWLNASVIAAMSHLLKQQYRVTAPSMRPAFTRVAATEPSI